jgi:hypothetical protein
MHTTHTVNKILAKKHEISGQLSLVGLRIIPLSVSPSPNTVEPTPKSNPLINEHKKKEKRKEKACFVSSISETLIPPSLVS